jgi:hypothetical protein
MTAHDRNCALAYRLGQSGVVIPPGDAGILRRAALTLHRWAEEECGNSNDYASWAIERDEATDVPYRVWYPHQGKTTRTRIPDRERGALRRVADLCARYGLHYYHQGDPRGCALYVSPEPLTHNNYNRGVAVA